MNTMTTLPAAPKPARIETTATRAAALVGKASSSCVAIRAMAAAIEGEFPECPVQAEIAAALYALADTFETREEETF